MITVSQVRKAPPFMNCRLALASKGVLHNLTFGSTLGCLDMRQWPCGGCDDPRPRTYSPIQMGPLVVRGAHACRRDQVLNSACRIDTLRS